MLFRKIRIEKSPSNQLPVEKWVMILRNHTDVLEYRENRINRYVQTYMDMPFNNKIDNHASKEEQFLTLLMQANANLDNPLPISKVLDNHVDSATKAKFRIIDGGDHIIVNDNGGYCHYQGYMDQWKAIVLDEIEKNDLGFPINVEVGPKDIVFLENNNYIDDYFKRIILKKCGILNPKIIELTNLKDIDKQFYIKVINDTPIIAIDSHFLDDEQVDGFITLFSNMPRKKVIIKTMNKMALTFHPLYNHCEQIHEIIFVG